MDKTEWVYYEYFDHEDNQWELGRMPADKAFICQLMLGDEFHYLDKSMIIEE